MSNLFNQALALNQDASDRFEQLKNDYTKSLADKEISIQLQIEIKHILDSLRSSLDYCASGLYRRFCNTTANQNIYFPIVKKGAKKTDFKSIIERKIPGLCASKAHIANLLESFQEFSNPDNSWLADLATLSNQNKHQELTPQKREEVAERVTVQSNGASVSWDRKAVKFGSGVSIAGVPIDPATQLPRPNPSQKVIIETWVNITFDAIQQPVLPFLENCINGVRNIIVTLQQNV